MFVHRRLAIQDLTLRGRQPLIYSDLTVVFNGEIYNFVEMRSELERAGYGFTSRCDTEVVLKAYHHWGREVVQRFNGQFALALWDEGKQELFLARDRFGMKPLYYKLDPARNELWFGSHLPAMVRHLDGPGKLDPMAAQCFFSLQGVIPPPHTPFIEYRKLAPGSTALLNGNAKRDEDFKLDERRFYNLRCSTTAAGDLDEDEAVDQAHESLIKSVEQRLIADVDVGVWLSGGLDSSLITAVMCAELGRTPQTFSIGFEDAMGECGDEFHFSRHVAERWRTVHHELRIDNTEIRDDLPDCIAFSNEPMMSNDLVGHYLLGKHTARTGLKVALSGLGGDEAWFGYDWHAELQRRPEDRVAAFHRIFYERAIDEVRQVLAGDLVDEDLCSSFLEGYLARFDEDAFWAVVLAGLDLVMVDDPVKRADSAAMRYAVEIRAPFLDHELLEQSLALPVVLGGRPRTGKRILKRIAERYFADWFVHRSKGYFAVPPVKHTTGTVRVWCQEILGGDTCRERGVYRLDQIEKQLVRAPEVTKLGGNLLWQMTCYEAWLQQFD